MANIVSMSVWGTQEKYFHGALEQIKLIKKWYPGFEIRIYVDSTYRFNHFPKDVKIIQADANTYGMFWRFEPLFESDDNVVLVRDADSRITQREYMAVKEWLGSNEKFHTFRDHDAHYEFPIIGCAFAMKGKLDSNLKEIMLECSRTQKYYCSDQYYLRDHIYPAVKNSMMVHSMHNGWFGETRSKLKNRFSFCGNGYDENDMPLYPPSLQECNGFDPKSVDAMYKFDGGYLSE